MILSLHRHSGLDPESHILNNRNIIENGVKPRVTLSPLNGIAFNYIMI